MGEISEIISKSNQLLGDLDFARQKSEIRKKLETGRTEDSSDNYSDEVIEIPETLNENRHPLYEDVVTFFHTTYLTDLDFPTKEEIKKRYDLTENEYWEILENGGSDAIFKRTGDRPSRRETEPKRVLRKDEFDPTFVLACTLICDTANKTSVAAKLKSIGLTTQQWRMMLQKKKNLEFFEREQAKSFSSTKYAVEIGLSQLVEGKDLAAIKYYDERTGKYRPDSQLTLNLTVIIARLMEVLARHLPQDKLLEVADEFEMVINSPKELTA